MHYTDPHSPILEWDTLANVVIMYNNKPNNNELFSMAQKLRLHLSLCKQHLPLMMKKIENIVS